VSALEATSTITAPMGATFTHSAWVQGDTHGVYDVEVGPRLTFRRTMARFVKKGDRLMDAFGQPSILVTGKSPTARVVTLHLDGTRRETFLLGETLNVFVSSEEV
jgi:hypothetical protein